MSDGSWEVHQAIYGALVAVDPDIAAGGVHAPAPEDYASFPYIEIGESSNVANDTTGSASAVKQGLDEVISIHVWSRQKGQMETKQIISRLRTALHNKALDAAGRSFASCHIRTARVFRDPDGITFHGVVECRIFHHV